jgi:hypothetical protein
LLPTVRKEAAKMIQGGLGSREKGINTLMLWRRPRFDLSQSLPDCTAVLSNPKSSIAAAFAFS